MKRTLAVIALIFLGVVGWSIGNRLSADAIGMALGLLFGVMAGIPSALLMLAAGRRREGGDEGMMGTGQGARRRLAHDFQAMQQQVPMQPQAPVIVLAGNMPGGYGNGGQPQNGQPMLPGPAQNYDDRQFRVVGEKDEFVDEW